jgi:hypothetical protein
MPQWDLICGSGRETREGVMAGEGRRPQPGQALVLLPLRDGETASSSVAYHAPLRQALIENKQRHVNLVVYERDYLALKRGIEHLLPPMQEKWQPACANRIYTPFSASIGLARPRRDHRLPRSISSNYN